MLACEAPITKGPNKGRPATGTSTGSRRHYKAGEQPCDPCRQANNEKTVRYYERLGGQPSQVSNPQRPRHTGKNGLSDWCRAGVHRMEGDNIYLIPSRGTRMCRACMDERNRMRRRSSQCDRCHQWFLDDEAWEAHLHYPTDTRGRVINDAPSDGCLTLDEMRSKGMGVLKVAPTVGPIWVVRYGHPGKR